MEEKRPYDRFLKGAFALALVCLLIATAEVLLRYLDRSGSDGRAVVLGTPRTTAPELAALVKQEIETWGRVVREAGIAAN